MSVSFDARNPVELNLGYQVPTKIASESPLMSGTMAMGIVAAVIVLQIILVATKQYIPSLVISGITLFAILTGLMSPQIRRLRTQQGARSAWNNIERGATRTGIGWNGVGDTA